jgi:hypothetical protein
VILDNATPDNKLASQRMHELSSYCGIPSRQIAILPPGEKKTDIILRLERTFNDLIQETYQVFLKKIRSRNVPNNNPYLLISQQYKMAFISELRMDTHSALRSLSIILLFKYFSHLQFRYYKQAYHNCSELDVSNCDAFEVLAVASLLNLKVFENHNIELIIYDYFQRFVRWLSCTTMHRMQWLKLGT